MKLVIPNSNYWLVGLLLSLGLTLYAQGPIEPQKQLGWIVMLDSKSNNWLENKRIKPLIKSIKSISISLNVYLIESEATNELYETLRKDSSVLFIQKDAEISWRSQPNDPLFESQWALDSIDAALAWEYTTGGLSNDGDTIVCGVIDGSFDVQHEDLKDNIWHNHAEIPNNAIDDDMNGFVDDYTGWQLVFDNDQHNYGNLSNHGTSILGIIGAKGNNGVGISGLNQQIKLLLLSAHTGNEITKLSNIIEGFSYLYDMRKNYNESNGQSGAFVVSVNGSWGINQAKASDHPIWCALYDSLGSVGILSIAATTNNDENIDIFGDMPCTCPSPFLISTGESTRSDGIDGGYGSVHLDLFAPSASKTTRWLNNYGDFGGTSGAAPHLSAAVALLYSYPHKAWMSMCKQNPSKAASLIKQILLGSVDKKISFEKSVSKGRLNVGKAMQQLAEYFMVPDQAQILGFYPNPVEDILTLKIALEEAGTHELLLFDQSGRLVKTIDIITEAPSIRYSNLDLSELAKGFYILQFKSNQGLQSVKLIKR